MLERANSPWLKQRKRKKTVNSSAPPSVWNLQTSQTWLDGSDSEKEPPRSSCSSSHSCCCWRSVTSACFYFMSSSWSTKSMNMREKPERRKSRAVGLLCAVFTQKHTRSKLSNMISWVRWLQHKEDDASPASLSTRCYYVWLFAMFMLWNRQR